MKWQDLLALSLIGGSALADVPQDGDLEYHSPAYLVARSVKAEGKARADGDDAHTNVMIDKDTVQALAKASGPNVSVDASASLHVGNEGDDVQSKCGEVCLKHKPQPGSSESLPAPAMPGKDDVAPKDNEKPSPPKVCSKSGSCSIHGSDSGSMPGSDSGSMSGSDSESLPDRSQGSGHESMMDDAKFGGSQKGSQNPSNENTSFESNANGENFGVKLSAQIKLMLDSKKESKLTVVGQAKASEAIVKSKYTLKPTQSQFALMSNLMVSFGNVVNVFAGASFNQSLAISVGAGVGTFTKSSADHGQINVFAPLKHSARHRFPKKAAHVKPAPGTNNGDKPIATNKFHTNMIVGELNLLTFAGAYGVAFTNGTVLQESTKTPLVGLSVQHFPEEKKWADSGKAVYNYPDTMEMVLGAQELSAKKCTVGTSDIRSMSLLATMAVDKSNFIEFPIVQGMGMVTAVYRGQMTPKISSKHQIKMLQIDSSSPEGVLKYIATLNNDLQYIIYASRPHGGVQAKDGLFLLDTTKNAIVANGPQDGLVIQVAKVPKKRQSEVFYDNCAGSYVTAATVSGTAVAGEHASYKIDYLVKGFGKTPMLFAMPHMMKSFDDASMKNVTDIHMSSGVKGQMTGVMAYSLVMKEKFAKNLLFGPWINGKDELNLSLDQVNTIANATVADLALKVTEAVRKESNTYFAAKILGRHALVLTTADLVGSKFNSKLELKDMKEALNIFVSNSQTNPIHYDTTFKGILPQKPNFNDPKDDTEYGSWRYANHNYHYGYLIHAAAVVADLDAKAGGNWLEKNRDYFNVLVKDVCTPVEDDAEFPFSRSFDWFAGHSWAGGAREDVDGQVQSSAGEDVNFAYAMKLWGKVTKDASMEARGDLMLAILARSLNQYHYLSSDKDVTGYGKFMVAGLMYHNKLSYETFAGSDTEFIHGVHMMPITAASAFVRTSAFAKAEWAAKIEPIYAKIGTKWKGLLNLNRASFDPASAYKFFKDIAWNAKEHDQGQSKSWGVLYSSAFLSQNGAVSGSEKSGSEETGPIKVAPAVAGSTKAEKKPSHDFLEKKGDAKSARKGGKGGPATGQGNF